MTKKTKAAKTVAVRERGTRSDDWLYKALMGDIETAWERDLGEALKALKALAGENAGCRVIRKLREV